jgi:hypothetical protein
MGRFGTRMPFSGRRANGYSGRRRELLAEAGFSLVEVTRIDGDPLNAYYICQA